MKDCVLKLVDGMLSCPRCGFSMPWASEDLPRRQCVIPGTQTESPDCRHKGELVGTVECTSCGGSVRLKVFACALHDECTAGKEADGKACCASCEDYDVAGSNVSSPSIAPLSSNLP